MLLMLCCIASGKNLHEVNSARREKSRISGQKYWREKNVNFTPEQTKEISEMWPTLLHHNYQSATCGLWKPLHSRYAVYGRIQNQTAIARSLKREMWRAQGLRCANKTAPHLQVANVRSLKLSTVENGLRDILSTKYLSTVISTEFNLNEKHVYKQFQD